jgi:hypothetical protein
MRKVLLILLITMLLGACAKGTVHKPVIPNGSLSNDKDNATVFFYRSKDLCGTASWGDKIVVINFKEKEDLPEDYIGYRGKDFFDKNELLIANRSIYSKINLPSGIHTFSFLGDRMQTARLENGKEYYLAVSFICIPGFLLHPVSTLEFRDKNEFEEDSKEKTLVQLKAGWKPFTLFKNHEYEEVREH